MSKFTELQDLPITIVIGVLKLSAPPVHLSSPAGAPAFAGVRATPPGRPSSGCLQGYNWSRIQICRVQATTHR
eukprot:COSAG01_NODE_9372_length_2464_cov_5.895560_5_plen_73_part_00